MVDTLSKDFTIALGTECPKCETTYIKDHDCPLEIKHCVWTHSDTLKRCKFNGKYGKYNQFCKRHCISYRYNPEGIKTDDSIEGCGKLIRYNIRPINIQQIVDHKDKIFIDYRKEEYEFKEAAISSVILKHISTNEDTLFWKNKACRKDRNGSLITSLKIKQFFEYCENDAIIKINGDETEFYCESCFQDTFKCITSVLKPL